MPGRLSRAAALLGACAAGAAASEAHLSSLEAVWARGLADESLSPVRRVVALLNKMKSELDAEADKEAEMYDKMVCWCETNEKEKTQAISDAEAKDTELGAEIESRSARFGQLSAEITTGKAEIEENTETLKQARAIREDEAAKFREENKDMVQAINNLRNAVAVLSKHQGGALLQMDGTLMSSLRVLLRDAALKYEVLATEHAERRGALKPSLLATASGTRRLAGGGAEAAGHEASLFSALNLHDSMSDVLPLKFAAELVARAAAKAKAPKARAFLQLETEQPVYKSYSSASNGIYGVMTQMLEEFEAELAASQKQEDKAKASYEDLHAAKTAELDAGKKKLDEMEVEEAGNAKSLSDAKEDLGITRDQRSADVKFLQNLQTQCNDLDTQWEKRSKTRAAETTAVAEAISVLTEDDNREMLAKSVTLLQERSLTRARTQLRAKMAAAAALRRAAQSPDFEADDLLAAWDGRHAPPTVGAAAGPRAQLSTLAMAVQLDSFGKVKEAMDKMHGDLTQEQKDEVVFKENCTKELSENEKTTYEKTEMKKALEADIARLESLIAKLAKEIGKAKDQIASTKLEVKKASQAREGENAEFQQVVSDQRATQTILKKALQKLEDFYKKGIGKAVLLQQSKSTQEPPMKFNAYSTNSGSSPVIGLIQQILEDSAALEKETTDGETKAQADYEQFTKDSNDLVADLEAAIVSKSKASAAADSDKAEAASSLQSTEDELESLEAYEADLHNKCDFVLKNFDIRQKGRKQEMESIKSAKAILSGAGGK